MVEYALVFINMYESSHKPTRYVYVGAIRVKARTERGIQHKTAVYRDLFPSQQCSRYTHYWYNVLVRDKLGKKWSELDEKD